MKSIMIGDFNVKVWKEAIAEVTEEYGLREKKLLWTRRTILSTRRIHHHKYVVQPHSCSAVPEDWLNHNFISEKKTTTGEMAFYLEDC